MKVLENSKQVYEKCVCGYILVITSLAVCCRLNCTVKFSVEEPEGLICLLVAII
jgi:hypothetical protein